MQLAFCHRHAEAARRDLVRICAEIREELEPETLPLETALALRGDETGGSPHPARRHRRRHLRQLLGPRRAALRSAVGRTGAGAACARRRAARRLLRRRRDRPQPPVRLHRRAHRLHALTLRSPTALVTRRGAAAKVRSTVQLYDRSRADRPPSGRQRLNAPLPAAVAATAGPPQGETRPAGGRAERQAQVVAELAPLLPAHALLWQREDTVPYECDGLTAYREQPLVVALPETEAAGRRRAAGLPPAQCAGGRARRRHRPVGRCTAQSRWA